MYNTKFLQAFGIFESDNSQALKRRKITPEQQKASTPYIYSKKEIRAYCKERGVAHAS